MFQLKVIYPVFKTDLNKREEKEEKMKEKEKGKEEEKEEVRKSEKEKMVMSPVKEQNVDILVPIVPQSQVLPHFDTHHLMKSS